LVEISVALWNANRVRKYAMKVEGEDTYAVGNHLDGDEGTVGKVHVQFRHVNVRASRSIRTLRNIPASAKAEQMKQPRYEQ
jgi:hypothetical protein